LPVYLSSALAGVDAFPIEVELDIGGGTPSFRMVRLSEGAVREALGRVKSAIRNSRYAFPQSKITINVAPAETRNEGSAFDLPMALGIPVGAGAMNKRDGLGQYLVLGELALDGRVKCVKGALPSAILGRVLGLAGIVLPRENAAEASMVVGDLNIFGVETLREAIEFFDEFA
jgi:magnesium chelatase family protein